LAEKFFCYRGGIKLIFKPVKTAFHAGRIQMVFTPLSTGVPVVSDTVQDSYAMRHIVDIDTSDNLELVLPYMMPSRYISIDEDLGTLEVRVRSRPRTSLLGAIFDVENPMKVGGASPEGHSSQTSASAVGSGERIADRYSTTTHFGQTSGALPRRARCGSPQMTHRQGGQPLEGCQRGRSRRDSPRRYAPRMCPRRFAGTDSFPARPGWSGACSDLGGETSPWKERAARHWKRCRAATDSSTEQGREVGSFVGVALAVTSGNGCPGRCRIPSGAVTA
jgi:hypothetical protein